MATPELTILSLGWGVQSFTLACMAALGELPMPTFAIAADTTHEKAGTYAFKRRWQPWLESLGLPVVTVRPDAKTAAMVGELIPAYTLIARADGTVKPPGQVRRQCTGDWKIEPMRRFISAVLRDAGLTKQPGIVEQWIGISTDEFQRAKDSDVKYIRHRFPLLERRMSRHQCGLWLMAHGLEIPPKSACTFCPFQKLTQWQEQKREGGADWQHSVAADHRVRWDRPPHPVYLHRACVPLEQAVVIPEDQGLAQTGMFEDHVESTACDGAAGCFI